jgi:hypothetical protein
LDDSVFPEHRSKFRDTRRGGWNQRIDLTVFSGSRDQSVVVDLAGCTVEALDKHAQIGPHTVLQSECVSEIAVPETVWFIWVRHWRIRPPDECTSLVQNSRSRAYIKAGIEEALGPTERADVDEPVVMVLVVVPLLVITLLCPIRRRVFLRLRRREDVEYSER